MKYQYTASDSSGKILEGSMEAVSGSEVLVYLSSQGLRPISIKVLPAGGGRRLGLFGGGITITDQIFFTKYVSLMLSSGVSLLNILEILSADSEKPAMRLFLDEVRSDLGKGQPFWAAFQKYPGVFSAVFVNLVKAGEKSGNLDTIFGNLSKSLDRERNFRSKLVSAFVYPAFIIAVAVILIAFLVVFAIPRLANVFSGSGFKPPVFSRYVFATAAFLSENFLVIGPVALLALLGGIIFFRSTKLGQSILGRLASILPIISGVMRRASLERFAETFSLLLKSGIPILDALKITSGVVSYPGMGAALRRVADEGLSKGLSLGAAFSRETVFPRVVANLIAISEKAGKTDEVLGTLANFYEGEVDIALKRLTSVIEPLLLLFVGGFVGLIALSVILPVYQLVGQL